MNWLSTLDHEPQQVVKPVVQRKRRPQVRTVPHPGRGGRPVKWGRVTYPTIRECAAAVGLSPWAVRRRMGWKKD